MNKSKNKLRDFYWLWSTQSLSQLGSSITSFALTLWLYETTGSALSTAALTICSYAPYVVLSIFAGSLTDRWDKKKVMLVCDTLAALCTLTVLILYKTGNLEVWHLYAINVFSGLMNTVQQPASEVAMTLIIPKECYQKTGGLHQLARSTISILNPLIATALYGMAGLDLVIALDLVSFAVAFLTLLFLIKLPKPEYKKTENVIKLAREGLQFLKQTPLVLRLILFMSGINLVASGCDATLPAYVIPNPRGGREMLGIVTSASGIAMIIGSMIATVLPKPKNRVKVVYVTMLFSMATENFILAFARSPILWIIGQVIGWILVPIMSTNLDVILRNSIPMELQGRVYACRNTLQFFTIPIGMLLSGVLIDEVCEPFMSLNSENRILTVLFGVGKGSGAAVMMLILAITGTLFCIIAGRSLREFKYDEN